MIKQANEGICYMSVDYIGYNSFDELAGNTTDKKSDHKHNLQLKLVEDNDHLTSDIKNDYCDEFIKEHPSWRLSKNFEIEKDKREGFIGFTIDPLYLNEVLEDKDKANKLNSLVEALSAIGNNYFNFVNNPPQVLVFLSIHIDHKGEATSSLKRVYSSLESRKGHRVGFNIDVFLKEQEEILVSLNTPNNSYFLNEVRKKLMNSYREDAMRINDEKQEYIDEQKQVFKQQETKSVLDIKI